jgi:hypothetical protein
MSDDVLNVLPLSPEDEEKRVFAWDVMKASNDVVVGFAKLMSTTSMAAIGVLLSLARFAKLGSSPDHWKLWLVGVACIGYLAATLIFSFVVRGRRIDISPDDHDDVIEQFLSVARLRQRMSDIGLIITALATFCGLSVILITLGDRP